MQEQVGGYVKDVVYRIMTQTLLWLFSFSPTHINHPALFASGKSELNNCRATLTPFSKLRPPFLMEEDHGG